MSTYRPWGLLDWVLPRCGVQKPWALLGCLSTGDRCLAAWKTLETHGRLGYTRLLHIKNKPSRFDGMVQQREAERQREFEQAGGDVKSIEEHELLETVERIVRSLDTFVGQSGPNIVLDVSALPKRFFFPLLKLLLLSRRSECQNLLVTYTSPLGYTSDKLAENCDQWDHLPLFSGAYRTAKAGMMVVNVGFEAFGLQDEIEHDGGVPIKLLVPFPAPPEAYRRSLELVRRLKKHRSADQIRVYRTDVTDLSDAFDRILSLTSRGTQPALLAPFGPKPISVAMCIYGSLTESEVFYSQPTVYHPGYSYGVQVVRGSLAVWTYCLRLAGRDLFTL